MTIVRRIFVLTSLALLLGAPLAQAQTTGSITGLVTDASGAVLPGVTITLSGERLIGGPQTQVSDTSGTYRFDRLVPGAYNVKFELQGFRTVERPDVRISAAFVATINGKMEVGSLSETITVTGESPTVDVRSNVQQTVMNQEILEGIPTGRDPWSLAKLIPGVQVATYDVGGTQSMQQSSMSAHGSSTNDVSYNIDGATVNWPGGGGGATMMYYDQGMFEEVNYMTSAIPAETARRRRLDQHGDQGRRQQVEGQRSATTSPTTRCSPRTGEDAQRQVRGESRGDLPRQPDQEDLRLQLLGRRRASIQNSVWVNGTIRKWVVNKLVNAKNDDGTQALDDNDLKNYSGKVVDADDHQQQAVGRRICGTTRSAAIAATARRRSFPTSPRWSRPTRCRRRRRSTPASRARWCSSRTSASWTARPITPISPTPPPARFATSTTCTGEVRFASTREEHQPNSRHQFDNVFTFGKSGFGGEHLFKAGVQWGRLYYSSDYSVQGDHYVEYNSGVPTQVRQFNTPVVSENIATVTGFFVQDAWSMNRLTLNIGGRWDKYVGDAAGPGAPGEPLHRRRDLPWQRSAQPEPRRVAPRRVVRPDRQRPHRAQGQLQPLRAAGRHRPRHRVNPLSNGNRDLPVERSERRRQVPGVGNQRRAMLARSAAAPPPTTPLASAGRTRTKRPPASKRSCPARFASARCSTTAPTATSSATATTRVPTSAYTEHTVTIPNGPGGGPRTPT